MALVEKTKLISALSPPFDHLLCTQLLDEFISSERRFIQRDWEPGQLDGGQFAEVASRIWYHMDSSNLNRGKDFDDCLNYIEGNQNPHGIADRRTALHFAKVLRTIYKFRSQRGAVHISPSYTPNHMDSRLVIECVRWCMNETLRVFWQGDRDLVAKAIRELLQFDVPAVGVFSGEIIVQRVDLTGEEEVLILLHYAGEDGFDRTTLGKSARISQPSVTAALQRLIDKTRREVIQTSNGNYRLTDLGSKRIRERLADKLVLS